MAVRDPSLAKGEATSVTAQLLDNSNRLIRCDTPGFITLSVDSSSPLRLVPIIKPLMSRETSSGSPVTTLKLEPGVWGIRCSVLDAGGVVNGTYVVKASAPGLEPVAAKVEVTGY